MKCVDCGKSLAKDAVFCNYCGIEQYMLECTKCGAENISQSSYCSKCGSSSLEKHMLAAQE